MIGVMMVAALILLGLLIRHGSQPRLMVVQRRTRYREPLHLARIRVFHGVTLIPPRMARTALCGVPFPRFRVFSDLTPADATCPACKARARRKTY